jgi:hypothetical protein
MPNPAGLQGEALFLQINVTRSAGGQGGRGKKSSINKAANVRGAESLASQSMIRKETTGKDMPMVEKLTMRITMNCAKTATRESTAQGKYTD